LWFGNGTRHTAAIELNIEPLIRDDADRITTDFSGNAWRRRDNPA
jgi:hypothetical protein